MRLYDLSLAGIEMIYFPLLRREMFGWPPVSAETIEKEEIINDDRMILPAISRLSFTSAHFERRQ